MLSQSLAAAIRFLTILRFVSPLVVAIFITDLIVFCFHFVFVLVNITCGIQQSHMTLFENLTSVK